MDFLENSTIRQDLEELFTCGIEWEQMNHKTIFITGAYGMLPSYMVFMCIYLNEVHHYEINIVAHIRSRKKLEARFGEYVNKQYFDVYTGDMDKEIAYPGAVDYIVHAASLASTQYYYTMPIEVMSPNILGTIQLLRLAREKQAEGFLLFSSGEVYGGGIKQGDIITEETIGGACDTLDLRNCYGGSKRMAEMLCYAWYRQEKIQTKIARICHTYGPTMDIENDRRVFSSFVSDIVCGRNIKIESTGAAERPFCYIADATAGFFQILLKGSPGNAYNVCNQDEFLSIKGLADILVSLYPEEGLSVEVKGKEEGQSVFALDPNFSNDKLKSLGWTCRYNTRQGFYRTIEAIKEQRREGKMQMFNEIKQRFENGDINTREYKIQMAKGYEELLQYKTLLKESRVSHIVMSGDNVVFSIQGQGDCLIDMVIYDGDPQAVPFAALSFKEGHEAEETRMVDTLCSYIEGGGTVLDIGANLGWYTLNICKRYPDISCYAFEPIEQTYQKLEKNVEINDIKNCKLFHCGLSNVNEKLSFYYDLESSGASSLVDLRGEGTAVPVEGEVRLLDDVADEEKLTGIDFIKCDVEGAELLVFQGGLESIKKYKPMIFSEMLRKWAGKFHYHPNDIIKLLEEIGYCCYVIVEDNKLKRFGQVDENTVETNYFFLHEEKHKEIIEDLCISV